MRDYFVQITNEGKPLVLIISVDEDDSTAELLISRDHFNVNRKYKFQSFNSLVEAQQFCIKTYAVPITDWGKQPVFSKNFVYDYGVTDSGTPQPYTIGFNNAKIKVEFTPSREATNDLPNQPNKIDITGNKEGLRKLAAQLLLCADSEEYDSAFHIHLNSENSNLELTLRAPYYFNLAENTEGNHTLLHQQDDVS